MRSSREICDGTLEDLAKASFIHGWQRRIDRRRRRGDSRGNAARLQRAAGDERSRYAGRSIRAARNAADAIDLARARGLVVALARAAWRVGNDAGRVDADDAGSDDDGVFHSVRPAADCAAAAAEGLGSAAAAVARRTAGADDSAGAAAAAARVG